MLSQQDIEEMDKITGLGNPSPVHPTAISRAKELDELDKSPLRKAQDTVKAGLGGVGAGVGGIALTGIDYLGRKAVNKFGTESMKENLAKAPTLQTQFKEAMGGDVHPTAFGAGRLGGEIASLAAPVGAVGKLAKVGSEALGAGKLTSKVAQAGTEGVAFTAGQSLQEGKPMTKEDYGINAGLNMAFPLAGAGLKAIGEKAPARIINSLIKPLQKDFAYGKNPGKAVAELGITGNSFEDLISNIKTKKNEVGALIGSKLSQLAAPEQIDLVQTLSPLDEAISNAYKTPRTNRTLIDRLHAVKDDIVDNFDTDNMGVVSLEGAQELKKTIGDLTKWTDNISDDQAVNKALQRTYTTIRDKMDEVLQTRMSPEDFAQYKKASEDYGNLISAENAAVHRDKITSRNDLVSFGAKNAGLITGLTAAISTGGVGLPALIAGLAGTVIDKAAATPAFKTRLASLLAKMAPKEVETFFDKVPTARALFDENQIKDFVSETVDNTKARGGIGGGFVDPSELVPKKKVTDSLLEEAKKYKSAEEFVKAQGTPVYHGSSKAEIINKEGFKLLPKNERNMASAFGDGVYLADKKSGAYTSKTEGLVEAYIPKDIKLKKVSDADAYRIDTEKLIKEGYGGVELNTGNGKNITIFDPSVIKTKSQLTDLYNQAKGKPALSAYQGEKDLTTKILKSLEGKSTVSKQFILDATNRGELKQVERDLIRKLVEDEHNTVDVTKFANKVKAELLPLKVSKARDFGYRQGMEGKGGRYEHINLPSELRGNVKNYEERIYESPIKTSAGEVHFGQPKDKVEGYFGHTRIEDMADNQTRRVIEVQSDLYQKGNLERERPTPLYDKKHIMFADEQNYGTVGGKVVKMDEVNKGVDKLAQYNDPTAHFRMIREEIKKAAEDGKTKLQFPTGETAMKIEGLGDIDRRLWKLPSETGADSFAQMKSLTPDIMKVGMEVQQGAGPMNRFIITDVLGDGKFKAIEESDFKRWEKFLKSKDAAIKDMQENPRAYSRLEEFDISGKVDTNNPIYKFYNKEVRNYLNKFGGKEIKDDKGVSWIEIPINKSSKGAVEAFGVIGAAGLGATAMGNEKASAAENKNQDEVKKIMEATSTVYKEAEKIAPKIDKEYIKALVRQESTDGTNDKNRKGDQGKYGWLVGFTKDTYKNIENKAKTSEKWTNLLKSIPGFDTPEDAIRSALIYSQFLLRDHTKEQKTGRREWKEIPAHELYKLYNGNASPKGVEKFKEYFNSKNK